MFHCDYYSEQLILQQGGADKWGSSTEHILKECW